MVQLPFSLTGSGLFYWGDGEGAGAVDGGEAVLLQGTGTPTVDASHAAVLAVEGKHGEG